MTRHMHARHSIPAETCSFAEQQRAFGKAVLDPGDPIPLGVVGPDGKPNLRRFNVYRNNVIAGQISTLSDAYPAIVRLVGEEFFTAMAREYVVNHPPTSPMMFDYGADFADFIDAFQPTQSLPYLGDVARIERAWVESYHAVERDSISPMALSAMLASDFQFVGLQIHPTMRLVQSPYPALSIWKMNTQREELRAVSLDEGAEDVLIARPDYAVHVHQLAKGGAQFFDALERGLSIVIAAENAFNIEPDFDLVGNISMMFNARLVVDVLTTRHNRPSSNSFLG
jgi:hypothetical protein